MDYSLAESELVEEVRDALAGIDATEIPNSTIIQSADRIVAPALNDMVDDSEISQDRFDNAIIVWTAEISFDAWLVFTRMRDREIEVFTDPSEYKEKLKNRTNLALRNVNATRPSKYPHNVVTVKHDGKQERVNLHENWR